MNIDLRNKRAVVCGSSQGIGRAVAREFAELGASVLLVARDQGRLEAVQKSLKTGSGQMHGVFAVDFDEPERMRETLPEALQTFGPVEILVNNTGGPAAGRAIEAGPDEFSRAFSRHLVCNQILVQSVVPGMKNSGYGRIINIISTSVKQPLPGLGVSNTIRGAVANWAKTLATELGPFGITVNNVLPGATATARLDALIEGKAQKSGESSAVVAEHMKSLIPARRFALPEELAYAVAFLASPAAAYVNGINLPVDGGRTQCL